MKKGVMKFEEKKIPRRSLEEKKKKKMEERRKKTFEL